jgi:hypothetical protein
LKGLITLDMDNKQFAEKALNQIFIGCQLDGVKFGPAPGAFLIRFEHYEGKTPDELWLHIESKWAVLPSATPAFPRFEVEMDELSEEEQFKFIFELRRDKVAAID